MKPYSEAVRRLGILECELCGEPGKETNPLTRHHCDGDHKNNSTENFLVVHRWLCHTWADWFTQLFMSRNLKADHSDIIWAYKLVSTSNWLLTLTRERKKK